MVPDWRMGSSLTLYIDHLGKSAEKIGISIMIDNIKVIRRRNTHESPREEDYLKDDDLIRKKLIMQSECRPSHWPFDTEYAKCNTFEKMFELLTPSLRTADPMFLKLFNPPCHQIQSISFNSNSKTVPVGLCHKDKHDEPKDVPNNKENITNDEQDSNENSQKNINYYSNSDNLQPLITCIRIYLP